MPVDAYDNQHYSESKEGRENKYKRSESHERRNHDRRIDDDRRQDRSRRDGHPDVLARRRPADSLPPPPAFPPGILKGQSRHDNRGGDRERTDRSDSQRNTSGHSRERSRDISWSDFQRDKPRQDKGDNGANLRGQSPVTRLDQPPRGSARTTPSGSTPPPNIKTAAPSNSLVAELRKAGKSLLDSRRAAPEQQSPPSDDAMEAGEIPAEQGTEERKRRHSPTDSDEPNKAARTGPSNMLARVFDDVASFKLLQQQTSVDLDAPAAVKSSPSISGDSEENSLDAKYRQMKEAAEAAEAAGANSEDEEVAQEKSRVTSRWLTDPDAGAADEGAAAARSGRDMNGENGRDGPSSSGDVAVSDSDDEDSQLPSPRSALNRTYDMLKECRNVDEFEKINRISEGTYGVVYKAREKATGRLVALKMIKMEKEKDGFPITSIREINVLLNFHHKNIVHVSEICVNFKKHDQVFMVMELMDHDLKSIMDPKSSDVRMSRAFSVSDVKNLMLQLLEGVHYLHKNWVLHRDLKASNVLYNAKGELKICDFGLARQYGSPLKPYTHMVVTLWYRAPELLLGTKIYSTAIDVWSLGCIMGELLLGAPMLPGQSEFDQLDKIIHLLGTPNEEVWPGLKDLPNYNKIVLKQLPSQLRSKFQTSYGGGAMLTEAGFDLLSRLLAWDPDRRISAEEALAHSWFRETPLPQKQELMPTFAPR